MSIAEWWSGLVDRVISRINSELKVAAATYGIRTSYVKVIVFFPLIVVFLFVVFLAIPTTRPATWWILEENHPVELLTFLFLVMGGIRGLALAWQTRKRGEQRFVLGFYAVFSIGLLFTAMEEVAWGQWFFRFDTPSVMKEINLQGEVTFHNLSILHGHTEIFYITFGIGGLVGIWLFFHQHFRKIGVPVILLPYFLIIIVLAGIGLYNDYFEIQREIDITVWRLSELTEMLIGVSGFLFVWLNARMRAVE